MRLRVRTVFLKLRGSDTTKLVYKLKNIQLEYEVIRSKSLADDTASTYSYGKEFAYDYILREQVVDVNRGTDGRLNIRVNPQRRSLKGLLLLFIVPYTAGARDSEHYLNPDITKVSVTVNGSPHRVYNEESLALTCGVRQAGSLSQKRVAAPT